MAKGKQKRKPEPVIIKDIPYLRCYSETGMIETTSGVYTRCYEILPPTRQKELTYSAKKVRECMKSIFSAFRDFSFQFVIHNFPTEKQEYLKTVQLPHGRSSEINACTDSYNALLKENVDVGHNNFSRNVYLCVSMEKNTADEALACFTELDEEVKGLFSSLYGYIARPLTLEDRLSILRGMYHPGIGEEEGISADSISHGAMKKNKITTKELIGPGSIFVKPWTFIGKLPCNLTKVHTNVEKSLDL